MKREFKPEMTVVRFGAEDVIATSGGPMSLTGFQNNEIADNYFSFGSVTNWKVTGQNLPDFKKEMSSYYGDPGLASTDTHANQIYFGDTYTLYDIYNGVNMPEVNGSYTYNGTGTYKFTKQ